MRYTSDETERLRRARQAIYVCLWFLDEQLPPRPQERDQPTYIGHPQPESCKDKKGKESINDASA